MTEGVTRQTVQAGLGTTPDRGIVQSLWMELPANCDLRCPYCFCATPRDHRDDRRHNIAWTRDADEYRADLYVENILKPFAIRIDEWNAATLAQRVSGFGCPPENADGHIDGAVAIPGAGEPFHPFNLQLVLALIDAVSRLKLHLTVFTTAHFIDDDLAAHLADKDVVLLVKYNSAMRGVQNRLVGQAKDGTFFHRRAKAMDRLMRSGFNKPYGTPGAVGYRPTRLGLVTSVMRENIRELPDLLRFARTNNLIFDCDTILERGRGFHCRQIPPDGQTREAFYELQRIDRDEFGNHWDVSRSYVGTVCDRFRHHLYVDRIGNISPCVGSVDIDLGNIRSGPESLYSAWNSPIMSGVIRKRKYEGPCLSCKDWLEEKCYGCLGRCRDMDVHLRRLNGDRPVPTIPCWNNRPL